MVFQPVMPYNRFPNSLKVKTSRPRDNQKSRLYAAEWECFGRSSMEFKDIKQLEDYLWGVLENRYVQKKYLIAREIVSGTQVLRVDNGAGYRQATTLWHPGFIQMTFPRRSRCSWQVLHELAHVFTPQDIQAHGREFARTYLHLVRIFFGEEIQNKFKAGMKKHNCKYSRTHSRWKNPPTPEEKVQLLARLK